jgi:two-component system, NtrC family, response regulator HydG
MSARLVAVAGPLAGQSWNLDEASPLRLGRDPESDVVLAEPSLSYRHCCIEPLPGGGFTLFDLKSSAGVKVNGLPAQERALASGDRVTVGESEFLFTTATSHAPDAPPHITLLHTHAFQLLLRSLVQGPNPALAAQLLEVFHALAGSLSGTLHLAANGAPLDAANHPHWPRLLQGGLFVDAPSGHAGIPLYANGALAGAIFAQFAAPIPDAEDLEAMVATLATLASHALEAELRLRRLDAENTTLRHKVETLAAAPGDPVGQSASWSHVLSMARKVAPQQATVLILGESGTGKEVLAESIHRWSANSAGPFLAINCAVLSENLLESELFGHERGAFTGADAQKKGKLEIAAGGTVFLDEIGEMAPVLQAKFLRVLQQRTFERLGGLQAIPLKARILAATHRDLQTQIAQGKFREDLYHRLNVITLRTPPLRDRPEDIPALSRHFLARSAARCNRRVTGISPEALDLLVAYHWPGNVRELENAIEHAVVLGSSEQVLPEDLPEALLPHELPHMAAGSFNASVEDARKSAIVQAWRNAAGDYKQAAAALGVHPNSLLRMIRKLGLRPLLDA